MAADKKITELPNATLPILGSGARVELVQGGINVQTDPDNIGGGTVPDADATTKGIAKLYADVSNQNTDGAPDQNAVFDALALKAALASPTFTGTPAAPTPPAGDSSTAIATTAFVQGELGFSFVSVTGAVTLDSTAFGKMHLCTGTVSAYTIGLPTAVGNANKSIAFKGSSLLTVNVTIDGNSGETLDGEDSRQFNGGGLFVILSDGTNWHIVAEVGSWVTYAPVWTGYSADPTVVSAKYYRLGKYCTVKIRTSVNGTSNATTKTVTFPFIAAAITQVGPIPFFSNNNTNSATAGTLYTRVSSNVVDLYRDAIATAWTASLGSRQDVTMTYEVQ